MKTKEEAKAIQEILNKMVEFLNELSIQTHANYSYPIEECTYNNETEEVIVLHETDDEPTVINVHMDSVASAIVDTMKYEFDNYYR